MARQEGRKNGRQNGNLISRYSIFAVDRVEPFNAGFICRASILSILTRSDRYSPGASARVCLEERRADRRVAGRRRRVINGGGERRCTTRRNPAEPGKAERARERVRDGGNSKSGWRDRTARERERKRENARKLHDSWRGRGEDVDEGCWSIGFCPPHKL